MRYYLIPITLAAVMAVAPYSVAQDANYDESKVPEYNLPNPLIASDGTPVATAGQWHQQRRPELLQLFQEHVYGVMPDADGDQAVTIDVLASEPQVAEFQIASHANSETTTGIVRQLTLTLWRSDQPRIQLPDQPRAFVLGDASTKRVSAPADQPTLELRVLIICPEKATEATPAFLAYNFNGNHSIDPSEAIELAPVWDRSTKQRKTPDESLRGERASRWPVGLLLSRGYSLVTLHYGDVDPDFDDQFSNGAHLLFPELQNRPDNWSSIGAWAWGLHRVMDVLEHDRKIDHQQVIVMGHSRLGKTSLWTGATDTRLAGVISNNSGCGGAALSRRRFGESVTRINTSFPHWFCLRHRDYNDNEAACPVDQHELIALMAPRPVYVASAEDDRWADPHGEFLSAYHAGPVYRLLGKTGLGLETATMPAVEQPVGKRVTYHIRSGKHDVTLYDWNQYLDFADRHLRDTD